MQWPEIGAYGESSILYPNVVHFGAQKEHCLERLHDLKHKYGTPCKIVQGWIDHEEKRLKLLNLLIEKYGSKPIEDELFKADTYLAMDPDSLKFPKSKWLKPIRDPVSKAIWRYEDLNGEEFTLRESRWVRKPPPLPYRSNVGRYEGRR